MGEYFYFFSKHTQQSFFLTLTLSLPHSYWCRPWKPKVKKAPKKVDLGMHSALVALTLVATGEIPAGTPILQCLQAVAQRGELFAGLQERLLLSALFGGVGLSAFEHFKHRLGIRDKEPLFLDSQRKK